MVTTAVERWYRLRGQLDGLQQAGWHISGVTAHSPNVEHQTLVLQFTKANGRRLGKGYKAPSVPVQTSVDAAELMRPKLSRFHEAVKKHLSEWPDGLTAEQLEQVSGYSGNTIRPRLKELEHMGVVTRDGRTRKNRSGTSAMVWSLVR